MLIHVHLLADCCCRKATANESHSVVHTASRALLICWCIPACGQVSYRAHFAGLTGPGFDRPSEALGDTAKTWRAGPA